MVMVRGRGGILRCFSADTLLLSNCIVSHNSTIGQGGAMYVGVLGLLHIKDCSFFNNTSTGQGGAIYVTGLILVEGSTFHHNRTSGSQGGAIYNTFGIEIRRSTFCFNVGSAQGASIYNSQGMEIYNSTIVYNSGSVYCGFTSPLTIGNSVIGFDTLDYGLMYPNTFTSLGYNVISPGPTSTAPSSTNPTDSLDFDEQYLQLLTLGNYGGPTRTLMPSATSYLIENGNPDDNTPAQNSTINNIREIGAAEYTAIIVYDTIMGCDSVLYNANWHYQDTVISNFFPLGSSSGSDSSFIAIIEINSSTSITNAPITSCTPVNFQGNAYNADTTVIYTIASGSANICDTVVSQDIVIEIIPTTISQQGDSLIAPNGYTYQWIECPSNNSIPGATNQVYMPPASGDYAVIVSSTNCTDTSTCYNFIISDPCIGNRDTTYTYLSSCNPGDTGTVALADTNQLGCDSTHYIITDLLATSFDTVDISDCDSALVLSSWYYTSTSIEDTIVGGAANSCDSIITYDITINYSEQTFALETSCNPSDTGIISVSNLNQYGCDSVHTITRTLIPTSFDTLDVTACDSTLAAGSWHFASSSFEDTITGGSANGCDSIVTYNITINYSEETFDFITSCNPGDTGVVSVINPNQFACDSTHTITTTLLATSFDTIIITACDSAFAAGSWLFTSNAFEDTIFGGSTNGCDSLVTYNVTINYSEQTFDFITSCNPSDTGVVSVTNSNIVGCDSTHTVTTTLIPTSFDTVSITNCDSAFVLSSWYFASTSFEDTIAGSAANGCDSILTYDVTINYSQETFDFITSCNPGDTGVVSVTNQNQFACDSTHTITTTLLATSFDTITITACDSAFAAGSWLFASNAFEDTIFGGSTNGCDSLVTYNVTINYSEQTFDFITSCNPSDTGVVSVTNSNIVGCDSTHTVTTTLIPTSFDTVSITNCDSAFVLSSWYFASTSFEDTIVGGAANGCDSIVTYNITINYSQETFAIESSCNPSDTGVVTVTNPNQFGCDSTHTITTNLLPKRFANVNITACDSSLIVGSWLYASASVIDTIIGGADNGCDSITTYNVTINYSNATFASATSCLPADTGISSEVFSNQLGCDSTHTITTTLLIPSEIIAPVEDTSICNFIGEYLIDVSSYPGVSYEWEDGSRLNCLLVSNTGLYIVSLIDTNGCIIQDTITVDFYDCLSNCTLLFPSGFSPNGDGSNDLFKAIKVCDYNVGTYALSIYNRMGERIFMSDDLNVGWDGHYKNKRVPVGVYAYYLEFSFEDTNEIQKLSGNISVVR